MADNEIKIKLSVDGDAKVVIDKATESVENFGKKTEKSISQATKAFEVLKGVLGAQVLLGAIRTATDAAGKLFDVFVMQGIQAARKQEDAVNQLNTALKSSGEYSESASKDLQNYASALQATTKYGDETILQTQALIQSLGQLDREGLKKATKATLDMSAALGIDLNTAALLVGKAAAGEIGTFTRYGLVIKKGADNAETFANVLDAINSKFGGAAEAQVNTFSGAIAQMSNVFGDLQETVGFAIIENEALQVVIKEISKIFIELQSNINQNKSSLIDFVSSGVIYSIDALKLLIVTIQAVQLSFLELKQRALTFAVGVQGSMEALGLASDEVKKRLEDNVTEFQKNEAAIKALETGNTVLDQIIERLTELSIKAQEAAENQRLMAEEDTVNKEILIANNDKLKEKYYELTTEEQRFIDGVIQDNKTAIQSEKDKLTKLEELYKKNIKDKSQLTIAILAEEQKITKLQQDELKKRRDFEDRIALERWNAAATAFSNLAVLSQSKSKELAAIGKAAAISETIIQTYLGAQKAFSALAGIPIVGPALGAAAAAAAIIAGLARVATIRGTPLKEGITEVPGIGTADNFPAILAPKERVVDARTNADLKAFLSGTPRMTDILHSINDKIKNLENQITVNIAGEEIVNTAIEAYRGGRTIPARSYG